MASVDRSKRMKKELGLFGVFALATGATLSGGLFLLPGLAAQQVGSGIVLAYLVAVIPLIPATFSLVELATAMPRAGGAYYFLDRAMGPLMGTIGGVGTWSVLVLKTAFALVGMGAYLSLFLPGLPIVPVAVGLAILFGVMNLFGAEKTASLQIFLVGGLLLILLWLIGSGLPVVQMGSFTGMLDAGPDAIFATAGTVCISYLGVMKVASVAEEVEDPERNIPLGVFASLVASVLIYFLVTVLLVGVVPAAELAGSRTPVASAAKILAGQVGVWLVSFAALLAFSSVANAGILSASRYPLAMSRDHLLPRSLGKLSERQIPYRCVFGSVGAVILALLFLDPLKIAKLASSFQFLLFALASLAVVVMRESALSSYDPGFRSPLYPYMQIVGIVLPILFIHDMGWMPILFTLGLILGGGWWFYYYAQNYVVRSGAIYHVFHRLGKYRFEPLDTELRVILREKGVRKEDPFDAVISTAHFLEIPPAGSFEEVVIQASKLLAGTVPEPSEVISQAFLEGTSVGATPTIGGVALPHFRHAALTTPVMVVARSVAGIHVDPEDPIWGGQAPEQALHAVFFLVSPEADPALHLRLLAQLAERLDDEDFLGDVLAAEDEYRLKEYLLRDDHFLSVILRSEDETEELIGCEVGELNLPAGALVAMVLRDGETFVPGPETVLEEGDGITILGETSSVDHLRVRFPCQVPAPFVREPSRGAGGEDS